MPSGSSKIMQAKCKGTKIPLSAKLELFCRLYTNGKLTAEQAYYKAGHTAKTKNQQTITRRIANILKKPNVVERLNQLEEKKYRKLELSAERIEQEYMAIAFAKVSDAVEWGELKMPVGKDAKGEIIYRDVFYVKPKGMDDMEGVTMSAIKEISMTQSGPKIVMHDKLSALSMLAKRYQRFMDRKEKEENRVIPIQEQKYTVEELQELKDFFDAEF